MHSWTKKESKLAKVLFLIMFLYGLAHGRKHARNTVIDLPQLE